MMKRGGEDIGVRDNPASYTPKHLAEKILPSRSAHGAPSGRRLAAP
jgi:hypothetical protein